jgi:glycosyltransferase involved in cell wall biosynthesis
MKTYYHFFCVRDSEGSIADVMNSIINQTYPPKEIIVVDDGSSDKTGEILEDFVKKYPNFLKVIHTNSKTRDYSRIPELWNMCLKNDYDFHMIGAGDVIYEKDYSEKILKVFEKNHEIVICSGDVDSSEVNAPHGAGRFVKQGFFFKHYEKYPEIMGYESEILLRALISNNKFFVCREAKMIHTEKLGHGHNFEEFGRGMKSLGYHPLYVIGRCLIEFIKNGEIGRRGAWNMFWKYVTYKPQAKGYFSQFPEDIRKEIRDYQSKKIRQFLKNPKKILKMISGN